MANASTIVIYYPNKILLQRLIPFIQAAGYEVFATSAEEDVPGLVRETHPDIVLIVPLAAEDLETMKTVQRVQPESRYVVLAETGSLIEHAQQGGADEVILYDEANIGNVLDALKHDEAAKPPEPERENGRWNRRPA